MKLRLILFEACNRNCDGCCNKDWDLKSLPVCDDYSKYELIMLTGGEPMLRPDIIREAVSKIREQTSAPIYLYTARVQGLIKIIPIVDGITLTLHTKHDVEPFMQFDMEVLDSQGKSLRLNVFEEVGDYFCKERWIVKDHIQWIKNCPLPVDEELMRYKGD